MRAAPRKQELFLSAHRFSLCAASASIRAFVDRTQRPFQAACENSKDYLHCVLSLEEAAILRNGNTNGQPS
jgi:hypothetical protein